MRHALPVGRQGHKQCRESQQQQNTEAPTSVAHASNTAVATAATHAATIHAARQLQLLLLPDPGGEGGAAAAPPLLGGGCTAPAAGAGDGLPAATPSSALCGGSATLPGGAPSRGPQ